MIDAGVLVLMQLWQIFLSNVDHDCYSHRLSGRITEIVVERKVDGVVPYSYIASQARESNETRICCMVAALRGPPIQG